MNFQNKVTLFLCEEIVSRPRYKTNKHIDCFNVCKQQSSEHITMQCIRQTAMQFLWIDLH